MDITEASRTDYKHMACLGLIRRMLAIQKRLENQRGRIFDEVFGASQKHICNHFKALPL